MAYKINNKCINCGACAAACPVQAITQGAEIHVIDPNICIDCGVCASVCPVGAPQPPKK